jgi:hypothetical protein
MHRCDVEKGAHDACCGKHVLYNTLRQVEKTIATLNTAFMYATSGSKVQHRFDKNTGTLDDDDDDDDDDGRTDGRTDDDDDGRTSAWNGKPSAWATAHTIPEY